MQSIQDQIDNSSNTARRSFLKQTAAIAGLAALMPGLSLGNSANGRLQHASIGVGGMGWSDLNSILNGGTTDIVAVCDVDADNLNQPLDRNAKAVPEKTRRLHRIET